jgi:hypothetical protein
MRDFETIETALTAAETGHLVMSTLHTLNAVETVTRIISVFPPYHQKQVRLQLAGVLKGVISQRLAPRADGMGRVPAVEVLVSTARVRECIVEKDKTNEINDAIAKGYTSYNMQSFDQSLMFLLNESLITYDEALKHCSNPDDFALRVKGVLATSDTSWDDFEAGKQEKGKGAEEKKAKFGKPMSPKTPGGEGIASSPVPLWFPKKILPSFLPTLEWFSSRVSFWPKRLAITNGPSPPRSAFEPEENTTIWRMWGKRPDTIPSLRCWEISPSEIISKKGPSRWDGIF